ncbi:MAG: hypothetical protein J0I91_18605 [Candidatus Accumulibacter sp.]|nr:hypothetical protein [Accumulibacter sp.]
MPKITGFDRKALPAESSLSTLWYIGWRNVLKTKELYKQVAFFKAISPSSTFLKPRQWIDSEKARDWLGGPLPHSEEDEEVGKIMLCPGGWLSTELQICPICLESGYHSYWHQLIDLHECPMHGCKIVGKCQSCGSHLPTYKFGRDLFNKPYYCFKCGGPISGAVPNLSFFREFREHSNELTTRFAKLAVWASEIKGHKCRAICHVAPSLRDTVWFKHGEIALELGRTCHPLPSSQILSSTQAVEFLRWRVQMILTPWQMRLNRTRIEYGHLYPVWSAFIRRIFYWVYGADPSYRFKEVHHLYLDQRHSIVLKEWDVRELAFSFLLEHCWVGGGDLSQTKIWSRHPSELPLTGLVFWEGRICRAGFMYSLLAMFAGLILTIKEISKRSSQLDVLQLRLSQRQWSAMHFKYTSSGLCTGVAVFPKLSGYPVKWSASLKKALSEFVVKAV